MKIALIKVSTSKKSILNDFLLGLHLATFILVQPRQFIFVHVLEICKLILSLQFLHLLFLSYLLAKLLFNELSLIFNLILSISLLSFISMQVRLYDLVPFVFAHGNFLASQCHQTSLRFQIIASRVCYRTCYTLGFITCSIRSSLTVNRFNFMWLVLIILCVNILLWHIWLWSALLLLLLLTSSVWLSMLWN